MNEKVLHCFHVHAWWCKQFSQVNLVCTSMVNYQVTGIVDLLVANVIVIQLSIGFMSLGTRGYAMLYYRLSSIIHG